MSYPHSGHDSTEYGDHQPPEETTVELKVREKQGEALEDVRNLLMDAIAQSAGITNRPTGQAERVAMVQTILVGMVNLPAVPVAKP